MRLHQGDCLEVLRTLPDNSLDSLVTDPPAGISFMGKEWDGDRGGRVEWINWLCAVMIECNRVLKPGAHGLVWALPRTSHWTATALEMAGFEIRDRVQHIFGSGFPKSLDVSKAIDKAAGLQRERIPGGQGGTNSVLGARKPGEAISGEAKEWSGWGTALKPASEDWWLVRKPLSEKTVAKNVLKWGTGALNIDGCRVETQDNLNGGAYSSQGDRHPSSFLLGTTGRDFKQPQGRFPSHLILDEEAGAQLDMMSGNLKGGTCKGGSTRKSKGDEAGALLGKSSGVREDMGSGDSGGASRFFYCAKVSASERGEGNKHPTVKAQKLMRYLVRMITPPGGTVLDCFMGSGSTGLAALSEGFSFVGIEREPEYLEIASKRIFSAFPEFKKEYAGASE